MNRSHFAMIAFAAGTLLFSGCDKRQSATAAWPVLYAPLTTQQLSAIVVPGISHAELVRRCGMAKATWHTNGCEIDEFWISMERMKGPSDWQITQFVVFSSGAVVRSWVPTGHSRISGTGL